MNRPVNVLRAYRYGDARLVPIQSAQAGERHAEYDAAKGPAMTLERHGAHGFAVIACAGLAEIWPGRFMAWALLGRLTLREFALIRQACVRVLDATPGRVEATAAFPAAEAFLVKVGFEKEGVMRAYWQGRDYALFARVAS
jgi:hypothetical protein